MDLKLVIHFIFLCVLNVIFFFSGVASNTLVIITILKTTQLRKKLCYFMIMVLSCCDLMTVVTYSSTFQFSFTLWFTKHNELFTKLSLYWHFIKLLCGFSMSALIVMCTERYLGVYYPIYHKTSVTRRRLLTLFAILIILLTTLIIISTNNMVISAAVAIAIFMAIFSPPYIFLNYKLFKISRRMRRQDTSEKRKINLKAINTCLLAVVCQVFFSVPISVSVVFVLLEGSTSDYTKLSIAWAITALSMNSSFNSLIFFWKNKVLGDEGIKIIKKIKSRICGS